MHYSTCLIIASLFVLASILGCSSQSSIDVASNLTVFAASSSFEAFQVIGSEFELLHPGVQIDFSFAGSSTLRAQLELGAVADLFVSANERQMALAYQADLLLASPRLIAFNNLAVVVPSGSKQVATLKDLTAPDIRIVIALPEVPVGAYARLALARMDGAPGFGEEFSDNVLNNVVSQEGNVRHVIAKVLLGEADAAIVYRSDLAGSSSDRIDAITIPPRFNVEARYLGAVTQNAPNLELAKDFLDFILSETSQKILQDYGFVEVAQ